MCATLNQAGYVHACVTTDVDALLFGAEVVYKCLHLQTAVPANAELQKLDMADVRRELGLARGGSAALVALAQLAGGDYDTDGASNVGAAVALKAVRALLGDDNDDDDHVLEALEDLLHLGADQQLLALDKCTGCATCGHESGTRSKCKRHAAGRGCQQCGTTSGCIPRAFDACGCAFHTREGERWLHKAVDRAAATPHFGSQCATAAATYRAQAERARQALAAVDRHSLTWRRRPDVGRVAALLSRWLPDWNQEVRVTTQPECLAWRAHTPQAHHVHLLCVCVAKLCFSKEGVVADAASQKQTALT